MFAQAEQCSWKKYVSSINCRTGLHTVWRRVQKLAGRFAPSPVPRSVAGDTIQSTQEVADELVNYFASVSHSGNHSPDFPRHKSHSEAILPHRYPCLV